MRIEHELEVKVSRYATVNDALRALYTVRKNAHSIDVVSGLMYGSFHIEKPSELGDPCGEIAITTLRRQALSREYEGPLSYIQTCAHVSFSREWNLSELYRTLEEKEYVPASTSESTAYLRLMLALGLPIGTTFHLGTHIVNERYEVQRLLVHDDGRVELVTIYEKTKVRPPWHVVVVKKNKSPAASVVFGRKK